MVEVIGNPINESRDLSHLSGIITDQQRRITDCALKIADLRRTLRDEFAMAALTGFLSRGDPYGVAVTQSYKVADQMLEARDV